VKKIENRLIFGKDMDNYKVARFWGSVHWRSNRRQRGNVPLHLKPTRLLKIVPKMNQNFSLSRQKSKNFSNPFPSGEGTLLLISHVQMPPYIQI